MSSRAWSEVVGEPYVVRPRARPACTIGCDGGILDGLSPGRARRHFALYMFPDNLQHLFVRIAVGHADVYRKTALGRDDVVLRTRRDDRNAHFDCSEQVGFLWETVGPEPFDVPHRFVDGIVPLFACGVSRFAVRRAVDYHQPRSAMASCISVGSPTIANSNGPRSGMMLSSPPEPLFSSSAVIATQRLYFRSLRS